MMDDEREITIDEWNHGYDERCDSRDDDCPEPAEEDPTAPTDEPTPDGIEAEYQTHLKGEK